MEYKCVKELFLDCFDEDCFRTSEQGCVPVNSMWQRDYCGSVLGGDVHLECINGCKDFSWIEIDKEDFDKCFEQIGDEE